jgi:putative colanic acid biosynthesis UDP-glucose lipid carrier transferase
MNRKQVATFIRPFAAELQGIARAVDTSLIFISLAVSLEANHTILSSGYLEIFIFCSLLFGIFAEHQGIYHCWHNTSLFDKSLQILSSWLIAFSLAIGFNYLFEFHLDLSKNVLSLWLPLAPLSIILLRVIKRYLAVALGSRNMNSRSYAILGANELGQRLHNSIKDMPWLGHNFEGFFDDRNKKPEDRLHENFDNSIELEGNFQDLLSKAQSGKINLIYVTLPMRAEIRVNQLLKELADSTVTVNIVPDFFTFNLIHSRLTNINGIPIISVFDTPLNSKVDSTIKHIEDLVLCLFIFPIIALPMLLIGTAIKLSSPGPVIFKQLRYGVNGEAIKVWKFRSMTVCENGATVTQATANDRRVTPLGSFLRRTSLDELPQFINVLQGTMSVVGPRPHAISHNEYYRKHIQDYMLRHKMKPGITGLAQISGCRGETETMEKMEARIHYDLEYIRHWSVFLDLKIVFLTIFKGFVGKDVY